MISVSRTRYIALILALICLFWVGYMMVPIGHHLLAHGQPSKHATQHSSVACVWMCSSSNFIQTSNQNLFSNLSPVFYAIQALLGLLLLNLPVSDLRPRSPPA